MDGTVASQYQKYNLHMKIEVVLLEEEHKKHGKQFIDERRKRKIFVDEMSAFLKTRASTCDGTTITYYVKSFALGDFILPVSERET